MTPRQKNLEQTGLNARDKASFHTRLARPEDVPTLADLIERSVRILWQNDYAQRQIESALHYLAGVDDLLIADRTYYVAEVAGEIAGCGGWSRHHSLHNSHPSERDDLLDPTRDPAKIRAFFVHPQWARQGIGTRILSTCEAAAAAAHFCRLELLATLTGESLYASFGFHALERVELEMPDGVCIPTIKMEKAICIS